MPWYPAAGTGGPGALAHIELSDDDFPEDQASGFTYATLSMSASGIWTFSIDPSQDAGGALDVVGDELQATGTPLLYSNGATQDVRILAQNADDYIVSELLTVNVIADPGTNDGELDLSSDEASGLNLLMGMF